MNNIKIAHAIKQFVLNRSLDMFNKFTGRDSIFAYYDTFGYRLNINFDDYMFRYKRHDIAKRIIDANVDYTWKEMPEIIDETQGERDSQNYTEFENSIFVLFNKYKIPKIIKRADKLACIGQYSVLVLGTQGESLEQPLESYSNFESLAFINVYSEPQARIIEYNLDENDPNYGNPKTYEIDPNKKSVIDTQGARIKIGKFLVDASRVIHIADECIEDDIHGTPKLRPVFNLLDDLLKITGGSSEMFWLSAYQGLAFEVKDNYSLDEESRQRLAEEAEKYTSKLQRFIRMDGVTVHPIGSSVASPEHNFEMLIKLISGASNIPTRILLGSEQGQLAASVDQDTFFGYIISRRNTFAEEVVLKPLIDKLISVGLLPTPKNDEYYIEWPSLYSEDENTQLTNANLKIDALKKLSPYGDFTSVATIEEGREIIGLKPNIPDTQYNLDSGFDLSNLPNE